MKSKVYFLLIALVFATLTISGCAKRVGMTDLSSDELRLAREAEKNAAKGGPGGVDSSGKPILYGDVTGIDIGEDVIVDALFDFDRYTIKKATKASLAKNAKILKKHEDAMITLEGHCDERGTDDYNIALGERRANSVRNYLINLGISSGRMNIISYGEERPFCRESTEECWRQNRRVHFRVGK